MTEKPRLSVVVANTQPWPEARMSLEALLPQVKKLDAELLFVDGSDAGLPEGAGLAGIRWLRHPGKSAYQLRALGMAEARGEIVAITEDHCRAPDDWCQRVLEAHRRWPDAAVIGGAVENGATDNLVDWATFFVAHSAWVMPIPTGVRGHVIGQANVSYKRRALPDTYPDKGVVEIEFQQELRARGETLVSDEALTMHHCQSLGLPLTVAVNYHNGRCQMGFAREAMTRRQRFAAIAVKALLPVHVGRQTGRIVLRMFVRKQRLRAKVLTALPLIAAIVGAQAVGELAGLISGPGDSPHHMR